MRMKPVEMGPIPDADGVPLIFLVLNKSQERHVPAAIRNALETSSQLILSQTASFQTIFQQQNRLMNFLVAYGQLGAKVEPDPLTLEDRADQINLDLGATYVPGPQYSSPGILQHELQAGVGLLNTYQASPDSPAANAAFASAVQTQVKGPISDWIGLVGDLVGLVIKPPKAIKLTLVPGSAVEAEPGLMPEAKSMDLITQRVLETADGSFLRSSTGPVLSAQLYRNLWF